MAQPQWKFKGWGFQSFTDAVFIKKNGDGTESVQSLSLKQILDELDQVPGRIIIGRDLSNQRNLLAIAASKHAEKPRPLIASAEVTPDGQSIVYNSAAWTGRGTTPAAKNTPPKTRWYDIPTCHL